MKTMKFFKKPALLLSIVVLAVLLAVSAIAGAALLSEGEESAPDYGEQYAAVQVATSGKVSLKFYYTTYGTATEFIAEVKDPTTGEVETQVFDTASLQETVNGFCVPVALAPSQMTHTVTIYANGAEGAGEAMEYSVAEYAQNILANPDQSEYHDAMRALLNWGAMAQTKFADATSVPANTGIFERNTNSIYGVNTISYNSGAVNQGSTITGAEMNLSLEPNNIAIHFYVNYTGNGTLSAEVSKDGGEPVDTTITSTDKGWLVRVANVPANMFDTPYTVTVSDGTDTFTATKTVREYLGVLLAQCNANEDPATGNVVRAMYQLYQFTTGNIGGECAHGAKNAVYWLAADADTQIIRCTLCHAEIGHQAINSGVNAYATPNTIKQHVTYTGKADATLGTDLDGTQYIRFDNFYSNRDNWGDISIGSAFAGMTGVSGQYMVMKYRVSAEGNDKAVFETYANTNKGGENGLTGKGETNIVMSKDDQWHTVIINLAERVKDPSVTFVDEGNGTYNVRYLSIRAFANGTTVEDDSEEGRYAYTYLDANGTNWTVYGEKLTEEQMAEKGYTELVKINKASVSADAYFDLAYVALCDSYDEAKSLIDTAVYEKSTANDKSLYFNTADDGCALHKWSGNETVEGNTYSYNCGNCGEVIYSKTVPESVQAFISPYTISAPVATAENNKITPNTHFQMTEKALAFDGIPYYGFNGTSASNKTAQLIWMRSAQDVASASAHERWQLDIDQSKYLVIKARGNAGALGDVVFTYSTSGRTGTKSVKLPLSAAGADEWGVYVVDLTKVLADYHVKNTETDTYELDCFYFHVSTFETTDRVELGYIAFVEDWADVDAIVEEETFYNLTDTAGAYVELNTADHTCLGEHTKGSMQNIDGVYKFPCTICGTRLRDTGVSVDAVNTLWSAETLYIKAAQTGTAASGYSSINGSYAQKELITEDGETFLRLGDAASNGQWGGWFPISTDGNNRITNAGRYMVMKVRNHSSSVAWNTIPFWITSSQRVTASWAAGSFTVSLPQDDEWHVIVIDLAARSSEYIANDDGTYDLMTMHLRPMGGNGTSMDASTDEVLDIAYMAFFDDLADIKGIVKEENFEFSKSGTSNAVMDTETGTCKFHTPTYVADAEDARGYHYECSGCGTVLAMDYYETGKGGCFAYNAGQYAGSATLKVDEAGFSYMSFLSTGTSGTFFNYNANNTGGGGVSDNAVRAGRYLVMKIKGDTAANVTFYVGTDDKPKSNNNYVGGLAATFTPESMPKDWAVVVFDLASIPNYSIGENHKVFMSSTTGGGTTVANGAQVDVAYVMLVNDYDDIAALTAGETVKSFVIPDEINWYASLDSMNKYQHTLQKNLYDSDEEVMYNRYTGTGGNHLNLTGGAGAGSATSGTFPTGKYVAIKYRLWVEGGASATGTFGFNVATGDKKSGNGASMGTLNYTSINQGEWRVAFMDVSSKAQWTSDGTAQSIYMMITTGGTGTYTFDIAWVAVVDDVDEIKSLLTEGETYYDVGSDWSQAGTHLNQDGSCVEHSYAAKAVEGVCKNICTVCGHDGGVADCTPAESVSGNTYTYVCSVCGQTVKTIEVPASVKKYYSSNALNTTAKIYYSGSHSYKYDGTNGVVYMQTSAIQTIWQRMDHDMAKDQTAGDTEQYTENVGNAKYLVIKARSSDEAAYIALCLSTTAKNSQIGTITEADFTDGKLDATKAKYLKILEDGSTVVGTTCAAVGDRYYDSVGYSTAYITAKGEATGEWMTYVIDLEAVYGEYYAKVEGQDYYDVDTFYFHNGGTNDIAYVAFVEGDWADVDALVEEDVVMQITAKGTSAATVGKLVNVADGSDAE